MFFLKKHCYITVFERIVNKKFILNVRKYIAQKGGIHLMFKDNQVKNSICNGITLFWIQTQFKTNL